MYEKCSSELERPYPSPKGKEKAYEFGKIVFLMESRVRENLMHGLMIGDEISSIYSNFFQNHLTYILCHV